MWQRGEYRIPAEVMKRVLPGIRHAEQQLRAHELGKLTVREREMHTLFSQGLSYTEIAETRGNQPVTIRNAVYGIRDKLGMETKQALLVWAVRHGLLNGGMEGG